MRNSFEKAIHSESIPFFKQYCSNILFHLKTLCSDKEILWWSAYACFSFTPPSVAPLKFCQDPVINANDHWIIRKVVIDFPKAYYIRLWNVLSPCSFVGNPKLSADAFRINFEWHFLISFWLFLYNMMYYW